MAIKRNDRRNVDTWELKLIRVGHAIWALYKRERRFPGTTGIQETVLLRACESIWKLKKEYRAELKAKRQASFAKWRASGNRPASTRPV